MTHKFRKKPVVIEAYCFNQIKSNFRPDWFQSAVSDNSIFTYEDRAVVKTLEGDMTAALGDWIIKGVEGELYPCKPSVFAATYEPDGENTTEGLDLTTEVNVTITPVDPTKPREVYVVCNAGKPWVLFKSHHEASAYTSSYLRELNEFSVILMREVMEGEE